MVDFSTEQNLPFSFKVQDGRGRTVAIDGAPVAASSDETVATVTIAPGTAPNTWDGLVTSVTPSPEGSTQRVTDSADADLGEGVKTIAGSLPIELLAGDAVAVEISAG